VVKITNSLSIGGNRAAAAASAPVANFTAMPTIVAAANFVVFTDTSSNQPTSWLWEWNPISSELFETFSTVQNPGFNFDDLIGTWSVRLTVSNAAGSNTLTRTDYITVGAG